MNAFTIKDLENLSGIKAHTLRVWEQRYSFIKPLRTETNIRFYSEKELKRILHISLLNRYGYKISHIDRMSDQEIGERVLGLNSREAYQERIINDLVLYMVEMDTDKFESELDQYILQKGIDKAITQLIFPFLDKIGILWLTNKIHPAQEHLVTNMIRQKLIAGIEAATTRVDRNISVILFLPEGEYHELGLLYVYYLLKIKGVSVIYLGASVPVKDLQFVAGSKNVQLIYTHLTGVTGNFNFEKFVRQVLQLQPDKTLVVSGQLARSQVKKMPPNVKFIRSLPEVHEFIGSL